MEWIKLLPHEEGVGRIGKEAVSCFVLLSWMYMVTMWAISSGIAVHPGEFLSLVLSPKAISTAILAVVVAVAMRKLSGYKPASYRYGWALTAIGMFVFPFMSLTGSYLLTTLFFLLWYYSVIWAFSWEAAPKVSRR